MMGSGVTLAAITLAEHGGGVAAASRLMWRAVRERWGRDSHLQTLLPEAQAETSLDSSKGARIQFGARLAKAQLLHETRWILYTHLSIAQVQTYVPAPLRRPYGIFLHGIEIWRPLTGAQRRLLADAAVLLSNSMYTADRARREHPWIGPIHACPLALPRDASVPGEPGVDVDVPAAGSRVVLVVGRMAAAERYKGHDQLIDAWPSVRVRVPDATLVFVGEGDDLPRLEARARDAGLASSVRFTGFVSAGELEALYAHASVFAMPSRNEGFGLVYLEAMAHGLPCIGSTDDAARDVIEDGVTGFLVDPSNTGALADRIVRVLADKDLRTAMGARGRGRLEEHFSYARFRDTFVAELTDGFRLAVGEPVPAASTAS